MINRIESPENASKLYHPVGLMTLSERICFVVCLFWHNAIDILCFIELLITLMSVSVIFWSVLYN